MYSEPFWTSVLENSQPFLQAVGRIERRISGIWHRLAGWFWHWIFCSFHKLLPWHFGLCLGLQEGDEYEGVPGPLLHTLLLGHDQEGPKVWRNHCGPRHMACLWGHVIHNVPFQPIWCHVDFTYIRLQVVQQKQFFSFFYIPVNAGSLLSTFLTPLFRADVECYPGESGPKFDECYALAFGIPGLFMLIALGTFYLSCISRRCIRSVAFLLLDFRWRKEMSK